MSDFTWMRRVRLVTALGGALFGIVVVLLSFLPGAPLLPNGVQFIPFAMVFPLFGWAVIERVQIRVMSRKDELRPRWYERSAPSNEGFKRGLGQMTARWSKYRYLSKIAVGAVIALWFVGVLSIVTLQGQPQRVGDRYYLNDHGSLIPVSKIGYESAIAKGERLFAAGGAAFLIVAAGMTFTYESESGATGKDV